MDQKKKVIGFIGQGWVGKHYADDFENRGFAVIRYSLEEPYRKNGEKIKEADIVFIAVPTPTTPQGFDDSILRQAVKKVGRGKTAVIKSTILPGTTESIQKENPDIYILYSPEFLTEATAAYDAANPLRNIIGLPVDSAEYRARAKEVMAILPRAPYELICFAREAEMTKYGGNNWFYFKVIFVNLLYDLAQKLGCRWEVIKEAMAADPRIGSSHLNPVHQSGTKGGEARPALKFNELHLEPVHKSGRGAGGHCFIKDFAAFHELYEKLFPDDKFSLKLLQAVRDKNIDLLLSSKKDLDLLAGVYGEDVVKK
jgi:UDPglucose 6-dehydrogenase